MSVRSSVALAVRALADRLGKPSFAGTPFPDGEVSKDIQLTGELGGTGTFNFGGFIRGEDFNPQMDAQTAIKNLDEMRRSDSQVHAALEVVKQPIRTADYELDPSDPDDPEAKEVADFVKWCLFEGMTTTWDDVIRQALLELDFGFMLFEKVWTVAEDGPYAGHIILSKLAARPPRTIWQWFTDEDGGLISIKQLAVKAGTYQFLDVPVSKLVRFTFQQEGDNFTGISMLRSAYPHWLIKKQLYLIDAIRATRFGVGIPRAKLKAGYKPTEDDRNAIALMLQGLSSHQHAYLIEPEQMEVDILMPQGVQGGAQLLPSIQHQNEQITRNILAQFLDMGGRSQGGSRALGSSAMDFFLNAIESIADQICDVLNKQLIKDLVDMNFDVAKYPTLRPVGIHETDVSSLAAAAGALAGAGLLTPDKKTENTFRQMLNLPEVSEELLEGVQPGAPGQSGMQMPVGIPGIPGQPPRPGQTTGQPGKAAPAPPAPATALRPGQANTMVTGPTKAVSTATGPSLAVKAQNVQRAELADGETFQPLAPMTVPAATTVPIAASTLAMSPVDVDQTPNAPRFIAPQKPEYVTPAEGVSGRPMVVEPPQHQPPTSHDPRGQDMASTNWTNELPARSTVYQTEPARTTIATVTPAVSNVRAPMSARSAISNIIPATATITTQPHHQAHMARSTTVSSGDGGELEGHSWSEAALPPNFKPHAAASPDQRMGGTPSIRGTAPHTHPTGPVAFTSRAKSNLDSSTLWRDPSPLELRVLELREIPRRLDTERNALRNTLLAVREEQILRLASAVAHARSGDPIKPPLVGKMASDIEKVMKSTFEYGHAQVLTELRKQGFRTRGARAFADWNEDLHPRGSGGLFTTANGGDGGHVTTVTATIANEAGSLIQKSESSHKEMGIVIDHTGNVIERASQRSAYGSRDIGYPKSYSALHTADANLTVVHTHPTQVGNDEYHATTFSAGDLKFALQPGVGRMVVLTGKGDRFEFAKVRPSAIPLAQAMEKTARSMLTGSPAHDQAVTNMRGHAMMARLVDGGHVDGYRATLTSKTKEVLEQQTRQFANDWKRLIHNSNETWETQLRGEIKFADFDPDLHPRSDDGKFTSGGPDAGAPADSKTSGAVGGGGAEVSAPASKAARPKPNHVTASVANEYNSTHGMPPIEHGYVDVDQHKAGTIADAYDKLPVDDSANPAVRIAYQALGTEIQAQWDYATTKGMHFEPWTKEGQPYQTSVEMADDVRANKHLYFYTGGEPHPFLSEPDKNGLSLNDKFRAIHDYFGHTAGGYGFGPRGEENAWRAHSQMFSRDARKAMTTETRGQNSWVNFGRQNYNPDGSYKNIPPPDRPYAVQKVAILPDEFVEMRERTGGIAFASPNTRKTAFPHLTASAKLSAQSAADKLLGSAQAEALRLQRAGWDEDEVEDALKIHMGELSDADITRIANTEVNESFSMGRVAAGKEFQDEIEYAVYSAILDNSVCKVCEDLDGKEFEVDSDDYEENMPPNPNCEGGDNCRCAYIYVLKTPDEDDDVEASDAVRMGDWDEDLHPRDDAGKFTFVSGGGASSSSGKTDAEKEADKQREEAKQQHYAKQHEEFDRLKGNWARINNDLLDNIHEPDSPAAQEKMSQLQDLVKQMARLDADPGGLEGIGLPGGARDVVIVGTGPGGMAAAINSSYDGLDTLVIDADEHPGGQSKYSSRVENYPGFPIGVTGADLAKNMHEQATRLGAESKLGVKVVSLTVDPKTQLKTLTLSNGEKIEARSVVIAGGVEARAVAFPGHDAKDIFYLDPVKLKAEAVGGKPTVVVGGSNGAAQAALSVAKEDGDVYVVSRSPIEKSMSDNQITALRSNPKIHIFQDEIHSVEKDSDGNTQAVVLKSGKRLDASGVGMFIGGAPKVDWLPKEIQLTNGKVHTTKDMETNIPGVFAVGDVRHEGGGRIGVAVGDGQIAARNVSGYFSKLKAEQGGGKGTSHIQQHHMKPGDPDAK